MEKFEIDRTEEEREELVKQWIKDYWLIIVFTVVIAIAAVYGLKYYKQSKINELSQLATETQLITRRINENETSDVENKLMALQQQDKGSFAVLATLDVAKALFDEKKYIEASKKYEWVTQHAQDTSIKDVARLRQARALANNGDIKQAIVILDGIENTGFMPESLLLKGDLLLFNKQFDAAKKAYQSLPEGNNQLVEQRINLIDIKKQVQGEK